jgi:hypothetical protein
MAAAAHHHVGQAVQELVLAGVALVVVHLMAEGLKLRGMRPAVLETVQVDLHTQRGERLHLVVHVDHPPVVRRERDIETDDMQVLISQGVRGRP